MSTLADYTHLRSVLFVLIEVENYVYAGGTTGSEDLAFSNHVYEYDYDGFTFTALGNLLEVSSFRSEIRSTSNALTLSISGIPNSSLIEIDRSEIKGSPIRIWRAFFNQDGSLITDLDIDNPVLRFKGFVNNYALTEEWDVDTRTATNTISLDCASNIDAFAGKVTGRKTNPASEKRFFPNDLSMDRVPQLVGSNVNFGIPT